jgi:hypothetical protein
VYADPTDDMGSVNAKLNLDMTATVYGTVDVDTSNAGNTYTATFTRTGGTKTYTHTYNAGDAAPTLTEGGAF